MFKTGQVVKRGDSPTFYLVLLWPASMRLSDGDTVRLRQGLDWKLIGNNYQSKVNHPNR